MKKRILFTTYRSKTCLTFLLAVFLLLASQEIGQALNSQIPPSPKKVKGNPEILRGIDLLYNGSFDDAEELFKRIVERSPDNPVGYFYMAMTTWSRLASGFWSSETVREYKERIDRTIQVAEGRIDNQTEDSFDFFYLGGALGFKGRFELMKGKWFSSFLLASRAIDALKACSRLDPDNKDVLLGLGTFDYYTARLSGVLKFLTYFLLHQGDRKEGLRKLHVAAREAIYSATEAKSMLLHIYLFLEEDLSNALQLAEDLEKAYDRNSRYKVLQGVSLIRLGRDSQYRSLLMQLSRKGLENPAAKKAFLWKRRALYLEIIYDLYHSRFSEARLKIHRLLGFADAEHDPAMIAWPLMKLGTSHDLEGNRAEALKSYHKVLAMSNGSGAQFLAKKYLKKPPKQGDPFIGY